MAEAFPNAAAVFTTVPTRLADVVGTALIVLDTNALLVPFGIGPQTLAEIESTYTKLLRANRLFVPAQAAREFANNRSKKLEELHSQLSRSSQLSKFHKGNHPMLEGLAEYQQIKALELELDKLADRYRGALVAMIWYSILALGARYRQSLLFVSAEEKADWWHRSEGSGLYPRFELVDEYRRASAGHSFHIIKFSRLLELFGANTLPPDAIAARRFEAVELSVARWFSAHGWNVTPALVPNLDYEAEQDGTRMGIQVADEKALLDKARNAWQAGDFPFQLLTGTIENSDFRPVRHQY